jgi:hypothetical protein
MALAFAGLYLAAIAANDDTCSRCREPVPEDEVPLMIWIGKLRNDLLIYCDRCLGIGEPRHGS